MTTIKTMTAGGATPDIDVIVLRNTTTITANLTLNLNIVAQTLMFRGTAPVKIAGSLGQTIDGGVFTMSSGKPTAPISITFVRNPDTLTQWLRVNR